MILDWEQLSRIDEGIAYHIELPYGYSACLYYEPISGYADWNISNEELGIEEEGEITLSLEDIKGEDRFDRYRYIVLTNALLIWEEQLEIKKEITKEELKAIKELNKELNKLDKKIKEGSK